jgi:hypothetical protein
MATTGNSCFWLVNFYKIFSSETPWAEGFQRRRLKCEKITDAKWWQKLTLPLARWAKNLHHIIKAAVSAWWFWSRVLR